MEKQEFLTILRQSLEGEIPDYEVENNIGYYEKYLIDDNSKTVKEKLKELGEPRLIAKTIIDAYIANHDDSPYKGEYYSHKEDYEETQNRESRHQGSIRYYNWNTMAWYQKLITIVVSITIIAFLLGLFALGINIFFSVILPVLLVILGIKLIMNLFR